MADSQPSLSLPFPSLSLQCGPSQVRLLKTDQIQKTHLSFGLQCFSSIQRFWIIYQIHGYLSHDFYKLVLQLLLHFVLIWKEKKNKEEEDAL